MNINKDENIFQFFILTDEYNSEPNRKHFFLRCWMKLSKQITRENSFFK